jgi:hypothetical protein
MFHTSFYKDHRPRMNGLVFAPDANLPLAMDDIINFILRVRPLAVDAAGRKNIEPRAQRGDAKELQV